MKKNPLFIIALLFIGSYLSAQNIVVSPYLQDAEPNSITIRWETDSAEESIVQWGLTDSLGNETLGLFEAMQGSNLLHSVELQGLERFTTYYYRVKTENYLSAIFSFKTPPFPEDEQSFSLLAMSDMQRDNGQPSKFQEIVEEGVLDFYAAQGPIADNIAFTMVPGDLVVTGNNYDQWQSHFFGPSSTLFNQVPLYPVLGNHENNTDWYFKYFKLPENGTTGYEEHWWYKDYSNVRIIGLNSNGSFAGADQLEWLGSLLDNTCADDHIDFVFAQLHHPHKSELWLPGESNFTGEVIQLLEDFSESCSKPSMHLFGHTHGYSRGQSRDHKHLWVNVASAGGALDYWGAFPNADYEEFSVSMDEYGFVIIDVEAGEEPQFLLRRISRGDKFETLDNVLKDSVRIHKKDMAIDQVEAVYPNGIVIPPECVVLEGSSFSGEAESQEHGQSHWQLTTLENGFNEPVFERWENYENWYYDINTQENNSITEEAVPGLDENTTYFWRVRYRDRAMNWSDWSDAASFSTSISLYTDNLIKNAGAEDSLQHWEIISGVVESLEALVCDGTNPKEGDMYFAVGGLCEHSTVGIAHQNIDLTAYKDSIDTGNYFARYGAYMSTFGGNDQPEMLIRFFDENDNLLMESESLSSLNTTWTYLENNIAIPQGSRRLQVEIKGTRNSGTDNDSYMDELFVYFGPEELDCDLISSNKSGSRDPLFQLTAYPNPFVDRCQIIMPSDMGTFRSLVLLNAKGQKIIPSYSLNEDKSLTIQGEYLNAGVYTCIVQDNKGYKAMLKLVVQ